MAMTPVMIRRCFIENQDSKQCIFAVCASDLVLIVDQTLEIRRQWLLRGDRHQVHVLDLPALLRHDAIALLLVKVPEQLVEFSLPLLE